MHKRVALMVALVLAVGLTGAFASAASASPSLGMCSNCHTLKSTVVVKATETANDGATASYNVAVSGPYASFGWAVYDGSTRIKYASGASGTFSVTTGRTYTVFGGNVGSSKLYNKVTVSPIASGTPDTTGTPVPVTPPAITKIRWVAHFNLHHHTYKSLKAVLKASGGHKYYAAVNRKGNAVFHVQADTYRLAASGNKHFKFKAKTVRIGVSEESDGND